MILKSFDFQCDFDFQITTSKMILILNHLYMGDLILILKSSTYEDFAHLWQFIKTQLTKCNKTVGLSSPYLQGWCTHFWGWHDTYPWVLFENRPALYFLLIIHLFLPIKYIFLFRIKDTVSDLLSVLLNFIANYDSKNENIPPYCL